MRQVCGDREVVSEASNERPYLQIPERFNIADSVIDHHVAAGRGGKVAAWVGERPYTYAEVRDLSTRVGNVQRGIGVKRGDRVLLRLGTNLQAMVAILGAMKIGAVVIPSSFLFREHEVKKILLNSEAVVVISKPELAGPIEAVCARTRALRHLILVGGEGESSWERLMERASPDLVSVPTLASDLAFIIYASGTTGDAKGVQQAHRWLIGTADPVNRVMVRLTPDDVCYQPQDWSFIYPLGSSFLHPLFTGASVVIHEGRFDAEAAFATLEKRGVTVFFAVPTIYRMMLAVQGAESRFLLTSIRIAIRGGETLPVDTFKGWQERFGVTILDGLGQTESHIFVANQIGMAIKAGSMGKPLPGYEVAVLDDEGNRQKPGEAGPLVTRHHQPGLQLGCRKQTVQWGQVKPGGWEYPQGMAPGDEERYQS